MKINERLLVQVMYLTKKWRKSGYSSMKYLD